MLITNFFGVTRAYWYDEGYIRTSSYEFNIDNFDPEIHLTNDFIQKNYPEYGKY
jgi:tubulin polyglutamylase TTLL1